RYFYFSAKSPSLTAAYAPAKKPMKLEPIVMIHGGSISDKTPVSMSQACSTAPPSVPASQKTTQRTRMSADCRASFIAAPKGSVPRYPLDCDRARCCAGFLVRRARQSAPPRVYAAVARLHAPARALRLLRHRDRRALSFIGAQYPPTYQAA